MERTSSLEGPFDVAVLAFVLHELAPERRVATVRAAAALLTPRGRVAILEWSLPRGALAKAAWRGVIAAIEGTRGLAVLGDALERDLREASLRVVRGRQVASGRARVLIAERG